MSDPVEVLKKEDEEGIEKKEEIVEEKPKDVSNADVVSAIKEVKEALTKPGQPAPSREQIRAVLKEKSGFTDAQLEVVESLTSATARNSQTKVAELEEKVAWSEFKDEQGGKIESSVEKIMKEELKQYDPEMRGDKVLLKKVFYLAKGILAEKAEKNRKEDPAANDKPNDANNIEGRKIVTNSTPGSANGLDTSGKKNNSANQLSDDEKIFARKMGLSEEEYAKAKESKIVGERKPKATFRGAA